MNTYLYRIGHAAGYVEQVMLTVEAGMASILMSCTCF